MTEYEEGKYKFSHENLIFFYLKFILLNKIYNFK